MVTDNAIMNIKEVKHCEAEDAWVVVVGEEDDDVEDDNDGDDRDRDDDAGEAAFPNLPMVIFTFIPWLQWTNSSHPGVFWRFFLVWACCYHTPPPPMEPMDIPVPNTVTIYNLI